MTDLDRLYIRLLHYGLLFLREAAAVGDKARVDAELKMLHNIPSLIGETNKHRHEYYWTKERECYIDWVSSTGSNECKGRMRTFYVPIWNEMDMIFRNILTGN